MATSPPVSGYRFGPFVVDVRSGELTRNGRRIRLQDKPCSLLIALMEHPGQMITRAELRERLWPNDTFVDFEDGLNTAMRKLREALDDDSQSPRFIETVRGRGYRLIASVEPIAARNGYADAAEGESAALPQAVVAAAAPGPAFAPPAIPHRVLLAGVLIACLVAAAIVLTLQWRAAPGRISIAVLPFANMTGDASRDYVCNGMTEELIARLNHLAPKQLRVIAPGSVRTYANSNKSAQQIAGELHVGYLIEGSLQQQGADIRVSAQLVRARNQSRLWADVYKGDLSDQFEFEDNIADNVAHALLPHVPALSHEEYKPDKYEAHDDYLKGLFYLSWRSKAGFEQAIESFGNAVAIDHKYAAAYAQLAVAYNLMGQYNWMNEENARSQGWGAAKQALSLDPAESEAHAALGFSLWFYQWDPVAAEVEFRKAIASDPNNVDAHHWYEQMLMTAGRFPEAERQMRAALDIDPRSPLLRTNLGWLYFFEGQYPKAIEQLQSVVRENPDFLTAHYKLWYVYSTARDETAAWQEFRWVVHSLADPEHEREILGAYRNGGYPQALRALAGGDDLQYYGSKVDGARCMIFAGDRDGALGYLNQALQMREGWLIYAPADPAFTGLRSDPRFRHIEASIHGASSG